MNYTENGVTDEGLKSLSATFDNSQIEWRAQTVNTDKMWALMVPYITARAVQARLDACCGVSNWRSSFRDIKSIGGTGDTLNMMCGISIRVDRGDSSEWVTKHDGAQPTDIEGFKGAISGAMRRAAVSWGIGRFLYDLDPEFVELSTTKDKSKERMNYKKVWYFYTKPKLPGLEISQEEPLSVEVAGFTGTYEEILAQMKKDDRIAFGKTKTGASLIEAINGSKNDVKKVVENLVKYFEEEK